MRPVNKGKSPYTKIKDYKEALPFLEEKLGSYCSYCEFPITHVPEVEHVVSKSRGGEKLSWSNLLLSCKYCNSTKKNKTTPENANDYLWPDQYNTALAFRYDNGIPQVNEEKLKQIDQTGVYLQKAKNLYELVKLDPTLKANRDDKRMRKRNEVYNLAKMKLDSWIKMTLISEDAEIEMKQAILDLVRGYGFISVWMYVFEDEPEILRQLVKCFPGTKEEYFDENGRVKEVIK